MIFMDDTFDKAEKLYRAVYPPSCNNMYWKEDGSLSSAAFADQHGLSVDRGYNRTSEEVVDDMKSRFSGCIVSVTVQDCNEVNALVKYKPSRTNIYHSEIHSNENVILLTKSQRRKLALKAQCEYKIS